jgi:hypothetical protein
MNKLTSTLLAFAVSGCAVTHDGYTLQPTVSAAPAPVVTVAQVLAPKEPSLVLFGEGCYLVALTTSQENDNGHCNADELYAVGMPQDTGDRQMQYDACYKNDHGVLVLRWVGSKPKGLRTSVIRQPFPKTGDGMPFPKTCKLPQTHQPTIVWR